MSVLLCDSNCELWHTAVKELKLDYISMPYFYLGKEYDYDLGEATDFKAFYSAVRGGAIPKTMALNPERYKEIFTPYFEKGEDVLYISFSHAMSATFNHLNTALAELKVQFPERKCTVFNTNAISLGAGIQVEAAAKLKLKGATDEQLEEFLKDFTNRVALYFSVDDLMHLKRGGRISTTSAVAGTMLGIKPILTLDKNGGLNVFEKVIGRKKAMRFLAEKVIKDATDPQYPVYIVDGDCKDDGDELERIIKASRPELNTVRQIIGPVIGSHCGPGTLGVIFIAKNRAVPLENSNG